MSRQLIVRTAAVAEAAPDPETMVLEVLESEGLLRAGMSTWGAEVEGGSSPPSSSHAHQLPTNPVHDMILLAEKSSSSTAALHNNSSPTTPSSIPVMVKTPLLSTKSVIVLSMNQETLFESRTWNRIRGEDLIARLLRFIQFAIRVDGVMKVLVSQVDKNNSNPVTAAGILLNNICCRVSSCAYLAPEGDRRSQLRTGIVEAKRRASSGITDLEISWTPAQLSSNHLTTTREILDELSFFAEGYFRPRAGSISTAIGNLIGKMSPNIEELPQSSSISSSTPTSCCIMKLNRAYQHLYGAMLRMYALMVPIDPKAVISYFKESKVGQARDHTRCCPLMYLHYAAGCTTIVRCLVPLRPSSAGADLPFIKLQKARTDLPFENAVDIASELIVNAMSAAVGCSQPNCSPPWQTRAASFVAAHPLVDLARVLCSAQQSRALELQQAVFNSINQRCRGGTAGQQQSPTLLHMQLLGMLPAIPSAMNELVSAINTLSPLLMLPTVDDIKHTSNSPPSDAGSEGIPSSPSTPISGALQRALARHFGVADTPAEDGGRHTVATSDWVSQLDTNKHAKSMGGITYAKVLVVSLFLGSSFLNQLKLVGSETAPPTHATKSPALSCSTLRVFTDALCDGILLGTALTAYLPSETVPSNAEALLRVSANDLVISFVSNAGFRDGIEGVEAEREYLVHKLHIWSKRLWEVMVTEAVGSRSFVAYIVASRAPVWSIALGELLSQLVTKLVEAKQLKSALDVSRVMVAVNAPATQGKGKAPEATWPAVVVGGAVEHLSSASAEMKASIFQWVVDTLHAIQPRPNSKLAQLSQKNIRGLILASSMVLPLQLLATKGAVHAASNLQIASIWIPVCRASSAFVISTKVTIAAFNALVAPIHALHPLAPLIMPTFVALYMPRLTPDEQQVGKKQPTTLQTVMGTYVAMRLRGVMQSLERCSTAPIGHILDKDPLLQEYLPSRVAKLEDKAAELKSISGLTPLKGQLLVVQCVFENVRGLASGANPYIAALVSLTQCEDPMVVARACAAFEIITLDAPPKVRGILFEHIESATASSKTDSTKLQLTQWLLTLKGRLEATTAVPSIGGNHI